MRKKAPPIEFKLSYETAISLCDLISAQKVHIDNSKNTALLDNYQTVRKFHEALIKYADENS